MWRNTSVQPSRLPSEGERKIYLGRYRGGEASAKTYAGVPVQGAKVEYQVTRRNQLWWWGAGSAGQLVKTDSCVTREDGTFDVEIPLEASLSGKDEADMSDFMRQARFFNFEVSAIVTDISGESHEGVMSLPLGTKPTILTVNLPKRIEADSLKTVTFAYRNASGMPIASNLKYRIDKGEWKDAEANAQISMAVLPSGVHEMEQSADRTPCSRSSPSSASRIPIRWSQPLNGIIRRRRPSRVMENRYMCRWVLLKTERTSYIPSSPATNCWRKAPGSWATASLPCHSPTSRNMLRVW